MKPFALFLALAVVGIAVAPDQNKALQEWLRLAGVLCLYVLVVDLVRSRDDVRIMLQLMLLSSLVPLSLGIYQYVTDTGNHETEGFNRIEGTFVHPSPYASYLLQLLPVAARTARSRRDDPGDGIQHLRDADARCVDRPRGDRRDLHGDARALDVTFRAADRGRPILRAPRDTSTIR